MSYQDNEMYKAFKLKMDMLRSVFTSGESAHDLSKADMFARDAFDEQQAIIDRLEKENAEMLDFLLNSDMRIRYQLFLVSKNVARKNK